MSIIINGMNMPKGNSTKNLLIYSDGKVFTGHKDDANYSAEERKKGKWIVFDIDEEKYDEIKCPFCKHTFIVDSHHWTDIGFTKDDLNYCPHCGADMRGGKHETN